MLKLRVLEVFLLGLLGRDLLGLLEWLRLLERRLLGLRLAELLGLLKLGLRLRLLERLLLLRERLLLLRRRPLGLLERLLLLRLPPLGLGFLKGDRLLGGLLNLLCGLDLGVGVNLDW